MVPLQSGFEGSNDFGGYSEVVATPDPFDRATVQYGGAYGGGDAFA